MILYAYQSNRTKSLTAPHAELTLIRRRIVPKWFLELHGSGARSSRIEFSVTIPLSLAVTTGFFLDSTRRQIPPQPDVIFDLCQLRIDPVTPVVSQAAIAVRTPPGLIQIASPWVRGVEGGEQSLHRSGRTDEFVVDVGQIQVIENTGRL
jgi:hypothetical protein